MAISTNTAASAPKQTKMTGARALIEALAAEGVEVIFGYPGAATIPIHDVLMEGKIRHILTRHEQGAAHAADGYARVTGKIGVCLATSGPGALNLVTGIATAYMDSVPMVAITGQVATAKLGTDAFQEADITGVTMPIVKHSYLVKDAGEIAAVVKEAFHIARTGRPGPVVIDLPVDVSFAETQYPGPDHSRPRAYDPDLLGNPQQLSEAIRLMGEAQKPVIIAGGGVISAGASEELRMLVEKASIPVAYTLMGKGAFPDGHPMNLGMLGMHGSAYANYAARGCDLLLAVGMRFSDRATGKTAAFAPHANIIHIDIDPAEISKMRTPAVALRGDAKHILFALCEGVKKTAHTEWLEQLDHWRRNHSVVQRSTDGRIMPDEVFAAINELTDDRTILATDVGQHQMWAAQMYRAVHPRQFLSSGGLGTMGYGLPAAIGAQIAFPERTVFVAAGDGSILMNNQEFMTAVEQRLPIKIALFNNGYLGMVRQWQQIFFDRRYASTDISAQPDFVKLAEAYGAAGICVHTDDQIKPALQQALAVNDRPFIIDFHIAREALVLPMIPTGGTVDDMILEVE